MTCDPLRYVAFSVTVIASYDIEWVAVLLYTDKEAFIAEIPMEYVGGRYSGWTILPDQYTVYDVGYYQFYALDGLGKPAESKTYSERADSCLPPLGLDDGKRSTR